MPPKKGSKTGLKNRRTSKMQSKDDLREDTPSEVETTNVDSTTLHDVQEETADEVKIDTPPIKFDPVTDLYHLIILTPFFIGRTHFCTTNLRISQFFGHETFVHCVAQETRIIRKLFNFFIKKVITKSAIILR